MKLARAACLAYATVALTACVYTRQSSQTGAAFAVTSEGRGQLAQVYFWRARPGKFDEYTRYIREVAEPIDDEAQRRGAFISVTTYMTRDTSSAWTHMRVFVLRDSAQLQRLSAQLDSAGVRLEPDSMKRRLRGEYSAGLRDRVGALVTEILR